MRLVADEGHDHAVQIEEEHDQVETQLDKRFLQNISFAISVEGIAPTANKGETRLRCRSGSHQTKERKHVPSCAR